MEHETESPNETSLKDKDVCWLSTVFFKTAQLVLTMSWVHYFIVMFARHKGWCLPTSYLDNDDIYQIGLLDSALPRPEVRDIAASFLLVTYCLKQWPRSVHKVQLTTFSGGNVLERRNRVAQTTGAYLKRFRQGLRHLEDLTLRLKGERAILTRRWKKVFTRYSLAEKMLLCDIRGKEKLIGFLQAKMQCGLVELKDVTSSVKISRDCLEVQREENKGILDQLEYFTQVAQYRH